MYNIGRIRINLTKVIFLAIGIIFLACASRAENGGNAMDADAPDIKTMIKDEAGKGMSKADMVRDIKDEVESEDGLLEQMPQLKRDKDSAGNYVYSYVAEGKQTGLENLDENTLQAILKDAYDKAGQMRAVAIQDQLEQLRSARQAVQAAQPPQTPPSAPSVPERPAEAPRR